MYQILIFHTFQGARIILVGFGGRCQYHSLEKELVRSKVQGIKWTGLPNGAVDLITIKLVSDMAEVAKVLHTSCLLSLITGKRPGLEI